jgi:hypothetical protein
MSFIDDFSSGTSDLLGLVTDTSDSVGGAASAYGYADSAIDSVFGGGNPSRAVVLNAQAQGTLWRFYHILVMLVKIAKTNHVWQLVLN